MSHFYEVVGSNAVVVAVMATILTILGRYWKHPASLHILWVLVLLKLFLPPIYTLGVWLPDDSAPASWISQQAVPSADTLKSDSHASGELPWSVRYGVPSTKAAVPLPQAGPEPGFVWQASWPVILLAGWGAVSFTLALLSWRRVRGFQKLLRSAGLPSAELRETVARLCERIGLRRVPRISVVSVRLSPLVWGVGRRIRIVLPEHLVAQLDESGREAILAHELAHVRRGDHIVRWVELASIVVFWWHPAVWWARRQLRELEEQCCDGMVLDALPNAARSYAVSLVETLSFLSETSFLKPVGATGAGPGTSLKRRIAMLKDHRRPAVKLTLGRILLLLAAAAAPMALTLAAESPDTQEPQKKPGATSVAPAQSTRPFEVEVIEATPRTPAESPPAWPPAQPQFSAPGPTAPAQGSNVLDRFSYREDQLERSVAKKRTPQVSNTYGTPAQYQQRSAGTTQQPAQPRKRAIFRLNNAPATDVAETIRKLYEGEIQANPNSTASSVVISSDPVSNCLLVSGSEEDIAQVEEFINTLDAPSSMVRVEMLIAKIGSLDSPDAADDVRKRLLGLGESGGIESDEFAKALRELQDQKLLEVLSRPQIMTLDNQPACIKIGEALVTDPESRLVPGISVELTPRVADKAVTMEIDVEVVRAESGGEAVVATRGKDATDKKLPVQRLITTKAQTTVSVADGRTAILAGLVPDAGAKGEQLIVVLTPHIVTQGPIPAGRSQQSATRTAAASGWSAYGTTPVQSGPQTLPHPTIIDSKYPEEKLGFAPEEEKLGIIPEPVAPQNQPGAKPEF